MNISCQVIPTQGGFQYNYVMPIQDEAGAKLTPVFHSNFGNPNLFAEVGQDEFAFTGTFSYSPNNLKAFGFESAMPPTEGQIILRTASPAPATDYRLTSPVPVPEPHGLLAVTLVCAALLGRKRLRVGGRHAWGGAPVVLTRCQDLAS